MDLMVVIGPPTEGGLRYIVIFVGDIYHSANIKLFSFYLFSLGGSTSLLRNGESLSICGMRSGCWGQTEGETGPSRAAKCFLVPFPSLALAHCQARSAGNAKILYNAILIILDPKLILCSLHIRVERQDSRFRFCVQVSCLCTLRRLNLDRRCSRAGIPFFGCRRFSRSLVF